MPWNGFIRCIDNYGNANSYTVGKVYEVIDGHFLTDKGRRFGSTFNSFLEFQKFSSSVWEEVEPQSEENAEIDYAEWNSFIRQGFSYEKSEE